MPFPQNGNYYGKQKGEKTFADFVENDLTNEKKRHILQQINCTSAEKNGMMQEGK